MKEKHCDIKKYTELNRQYKIIAFDWDGTAVKDRNEKIPELIKTLNILLQKKIYIAVITGTNFNNIDKQFCSYIKGKQKELLYILTNRGSEVYNFDENSNPKMIYRLIAGENENLLLDKAAEQAKRSIEKKSRGIKLNIIYDRLNRRKLDLIPEWENPKKSEIEKLINLTENKLKNCGFCGGIKEAYNIMQTSAVQAGLINPRITSDVKHIEVGLSDKSDSALWILENIAEPNNIADSEILVLGDEFGSISGFEGSDFKMIIKNRKNITYVSVGKEPNNAPEGVMHISGGPECFLKIMQLQANL